jgi:hypothetical protein
MESLIPIDAAARALGKSTEAVRKAIERHRVPVVHASGRVRVFVRLSDVQAAYAQMADRGW